MLSIFFSVLMSVLYDSGKRDAEEIIEKQVVVQAIEKRKTETKTSNRWQVGYIFN